MNREWRSVHGAQNPTRDAAPWSTDRAGLSLIEVLMAVILLGFGLMGLAAGSGWMVGSRDHGADEAGRTAALRTAVEEVGAMPYDSIRSGYKKHREFEVTWTPIEETPASILLRFVVVDDGIVGNGGSRAGRSVADTLEHRLARP